MSKYGLLVGGCAVVVVALAAASLSYALTGQEPREPRTPRVEYVSSSAGTPAVVTSSPLPFPLVGRRAGRASIPETLTLVVVGSMLIGLAAAVRRTT